jgi:hypothetical protein
MAVPAASASPAVAIVQLLDGTAAAEDSAAPPAFADPADIPMLRHARLAPARLEQLLAAAGRERDDPPPPPRPDECCGSSCSPCVKQLWSEELRAWKERWGVGAAAAARRAAKAEARLAVGLAKAGKAGVQRTQEPSETGTMPGAFDW